MCSSTLTKSVEQNCTNIAEHIKTVTDDTILIHQMTLYFKIDENYELWLILCTNIKFKDPVSLWKNSMPLNSQHDIRLRVVEEVLETNISQVRKDVCIDKLGGNKFEVNPSQSICASCYSRLVIIV